MSNETESKRLTVTDPVDKPTLEKLGELEGAKFQLAGQLLEMEQERVKLLAAAHQVDQQRQRLFEKILIERGLPPNAGVEINSTNGLIKVHNIPGAPVATAVSSEPTQVNGEAAQPS